jgi:hypothetical protein
MLTPDPGSHLSEGVVVETRLRARLFGVPVLRIDGTVLVSPARVEPFDSPRPVRGEVERTPRASVGRAPGAALAEATRLLEDTRARLADEG